jgi:hypothetical protein
MGIYCFLLSPPLVEQHNERRKKLVPNLDSGLRSGEAAIGDRQR